MKKSVREKLMLINDLVRKANLSDQMKLFLLTLTSLPNNKLERLHICTDVSLAQNILIINEKEAKKEIMLSVDNYKPMEIFSELSKDRPVNILCLLDVVEEMDNKMVEGNSIVLMNMVTRLLQADHDIVMSVGFDDGAPPEWFTKQCEPNAYVELFTKYTQLGKIVEVFDDEDVEDDDPRPSPLSTTKPTLIDAEIELAMLRLDLEKALEQHDFQKCKELKAKIDRIKADNSTK